MARPLRVATNAANATPTSPDTAYIGDSRLTIRASERTSARPTATIAAVFVFDPDAV